MKLLKEIYKTYEGARKRAAFENSLARSEFERGYKAKHYRYSIVAQTQSTAAVSAGITKDNNVYRVRREAIKTIEDKLDDLLGRQTPEEYKKGFES